MKRRFLYKLSRIVECDKSQETICKGLKGILSSFEEFIKSFVQHIRACWKHKFLNKRQPFQWKKICRLVFSYYRVWQTSRDKIEGSKRCSKFYCGRYRINSVTPKSLLKTLIFQEKAITPVKIFYGLFFLALSGVTNLTQQIERVQKVF